MRRLVGTFAGRTYHIVGNLMSRLKYASANVDMGKEADVTVPNATMNQMHQLMHMQNMCPFAIFSPASSDHCDNSLATNEIISKR